jgi:hypothetical protein
VDICKYMEVVDADCQHVGTVAKVEGGRIKLIKKDAFDQKHPYVDKSQVAFVEGNLVKLSRQVSAIAARAFVSQVR